MYIIFSVSLFVFFHRRGRRPCGRHAAGCWTKWWARAQCGRSSQALEQGRGPSASPPAPATPPTHPPAQGALGSCARPADWPSPSSDARWTRVVPRVKCFQRPVTSSSILFEAVIYSMVAFSDNGSCFLKLETAHMMFLFFKFKILCSDLLYQLPVPPQGWCYSASWFKSTCSDRTCLNNPSHSTFTQRFFLCVRVWITQTLRAVVRGTAHSWCIQGNTDIHNYWFTFWTVTFFILKSAKYIFLNSVWTESNNCKGCMLFFRHRVRVKRDSSHECASFWEVETIQYTPFSRVNGNTNNRKLFLEVKYIYSTTIWKYNLEVLVLNLSISGWCDSLHFTFYSIAFICQRQLLPFTLSVATISTKVWYLFQMSLIFSFKSFTCAKRG